MPLQLILYGESPPPLKEHSRQQPLCTGHTLQGDYFIFYLLLFIFYFPPIVLTLKSNASSPRVTLPPPR